MNLKIALALAFAAIFSEYGCISTMKVSSSPVTNPFIQQESTSAQKHHCATNTAHDRGYNSESLPVAVTASEYLAGIAAQNTVNTSEKLCVKPEGKPSWLCGLDAAVQATIGVDVSPLAAFNAWADQVFIPCNSAALKPAIQVLCFKVSTMVQAQVSAVVHALDPSIGVSSIFTH